MKRTIDDESEGQYQELWGARELYVSRHLFNYFHAINKVMAEYASMPITDVTEDFLSQELDDLQDEYARKIVKGLYR